MLNWVMKMQFRQAVIDDLEEIINIFQKCIQKLDQDQIFQWDEIYPDHELIKEDVLSKCMYLGIIDEQIVSVYVVNEEGYEEYDVESWQRSEHCAFLHRFCVHPKYQGQGIGHQTLKYLHEQLKKHNYQAVHLDVFNHNLAAIALYEKNGYQRVGKVTFRKGQFILMEKIL